GDPNCTFDFWSLAPPTGIPSPGAIALPGAGTIRYSSGPAVRIQNGGYGGQGSIFVDGDVYITGNVAYTAGPWGVGAIPTLYIVARGNIYIDPAVSQLDGVYVSYGTIYTCAPGGVNVPNTAAGVYLPGGSCHNNQLRVNGAFL